MGNVSSGLSLLSSSPTDMTNDDVPWLLRLAAKWFGLRHFMHVYEGIHTRFGSKGTECLIGFTFEGKHRPD